MVNFTLSICDLNQLNGQHIAYVCSTLLLLRKVLVICMNSTCTVQINVLADLVTVLYMYKSYLHKVGDFYLDIH